jgi:hypothetical protein
MCVSLQFRDEKEGYNWTKVENSAQESSTSTVLSTTLAGLDKFTEYEVVISAYNEQGQGPSTQSFVVVTMEDGKLTSKLAPIEMFLLIYSFFYLYSLSRTVPSLYYPDLLQKANAG